MTATPDHLRIQPETASPVAPEADVRLDRLKSLGDLRVSGVLTEEEFERVKARILA